MRVGKASAIAIGVAAVIGVAGLAHAGYEDDYAAGWKALSANNLDAAQRYFQAALDAESSSTSEVSLDGNPQPYLPQHFLGVVAFRRGDCAAAGNYWNSANNKRMTSRLAMVRREESQWLASCKTTIAKAAPTPVAVPAIPVTTTAPAPVTPAPASVTKPVPPDVLKQALQSYISGSYANAARIDPTTLSEPRAKFHAFLIRAAARFMSANTGGDAALLEGARADIRAAHAIDARTQPDAATFAPRFRAFYSETR